MIFSITHLFITLSLNLTCLVTFNVLLFIFLATSLLSLEAGGGSGGSPLGGYEYEWRPPAQNSGVRDWRQAISTPLAYRYLYKIGDFYVWGYVSPAFI